MCQAKDTTVINMERFKALAMNQSDLESGEGFELYNPDGTCMSFNPTGSFRVITCAPTVTRWFNILHQLSWTDAKRRQLIPEAYPSRSL